MHKLYASFALWIFIVLMLCTLPSVWAQERIVMVDFESSSFQGNPKIPYDQPFMIQGEAGREVELVRVNIYYEGKKDVLHSFLWNRFRNESELFKITVPAVLKSSTKYDFEVITYTLLSDAQKAQLLQALGQRVYFFLSGYTYFDGRRVVISQPEKVYRALKNLLEESLSYHTSKNALQLAAPSHMVLDELKKQGRFRFRPYMRRHNTVEKDSIVRQMIDRQLQYLTSMVLSEVSPYINSELVQMHRRLHILSVETDKAPFVIPLNVGAYVWYAASSPAANWQDAWGILPGAGLSIPLSSKSSFASRLRLVDAFGISLGVLWRPIKDNQDEAWMLPGIGLPVYTTLGVRFFRLLRLGGGVVWVADGQSARNFEVVPVGSLSIELNLWMGIRK